MTPFRVRARLEQLRMKPVELAALVGTTPQYLSRVMAKPVLPKGIAARIERVLREPLDPRPRRPSGDVVGG